MKYRLEVRVGEAQIVEHITVERHTLDELPVFSIERTSQEEFEKAARELKHFLAERGEEALIIPSWVQVLRLVPIDEEVTP